MTGNFAVTWIAPNTGGSTTRYELERARPSSASWTQVASSLPVQGSYTSPANSLLYEWSNLFDQIDGINFGDWQYRIRACNNSGCGPWSTQVVEFVAGQPAGIPQRPFDVEWPSASANGEASITWTVSALATFYRVEFREVSSPTWSVAGSSIGRPPFSVNFLSNGNWYVRVAACNPTACSTYPDDGFTVVGPIAVSGIGPIIPAAPSVSASPLTSPTGSFSVSWNAPSGATRYEWQQGSVSGSATTWAPALNPTSGLGTSVANLAAGSYRFRVRACSATPASTCGAFGESNTVASTVPIASGETFFFHHFNAQGSVVATTDAAGSLRASTYFRPFGTAIARSAGTTPTRLGFTGKLADVDLGLIYFGARYYDPTYGRFVSVDPADFSQDDLLSFNRYSYANNSPFRFGDPDGRRSRDFEAISREAGLSVATAPQRSADDWLGPAIGLALTAVAAPVVAVAGYELALVALANPVATNVVAVNLVEAGAGNALGGATLAGAAIATVRTSAKPFALGLREYLDDFATARGASTFRDLPD